MMNQHRKKYFIDPRFQGGFILKFCLMVIAASFLVGIIVFALTGGSTTVAIENTRVFVKPTSAFILPVLGVTVLVVSAFTAAAVAVMTLVQSHRIAGPLVRINREVEALKKGGLNRDFTIRDRDHLQDLARNLGVMSDALKQKHVELNNKVHLLASFLSAREQDLSPQHREELRAILDELSEVLGFFKVE